MSLKTFKGAAKRLDDIDLPRIGAIIGVGEDEIHAFIEVEAAGSGFDSEGRPKMLFEPHLFWRELGPGDKRNRAAAQGLAYASWRSGEYPRDSYPRLLSAMKIDEVAALRSASWGLGQILGSNHKAAGYVSTRAMVTAFMENEEFHIEAMIRFLQANKLDDDLRAHRWEALAKGYNGPAYRKHNYHGRLAAAFQRWRRIKDTPLPTQQLATRQEPVPADDKQMEMTSVSPTPVSADPPAVQTTTPAGTPEKPWWSEWPILRPIGQAMAGLGITGTTLFSADWKAVAVIGGITVLTIAAFAIVNQIKRRKP